MLTLNADIKVGDLLYMPGDDMNAALCRAQQQLDIITTGMILIVVDIDYHTDAVKWPDRLWVSGVLINSHVSSAQPIRIFPLTYNSWTGHLMVLDDPTMTS